nr:O-acetyl-ADP-ribose deacetylase [Lacticaseibacillus zhaodongensis]
MVKLSAQNADITKLAVDAIVNAANPSLLGGGGVDGAIHRAAGPELLAACRKFNGCARGQAVITPGFKLPARFVIHTPGPIWRGGKENEVVVLAQSYANSLRLAAANNCQSVAIPAISAGVYHFPLQLAAAVAVSAVTSFISTQHSQLEQIKFVDVNAATVAAFAKLIAVQ